MNSRNHKNRRAGTLCFDDGQGGFKGTVREKRLRAAGDGKFLEKEAAKIGGQHLRRVKVIGWIDQHLGELLPAGA